MNNKKCMFSFHVYKGKFDCVVFFYINEFHAEKKIKGFQVICVICGYMCQVNLLGLVNLASQNSFVSIIWLYFI